MGYKNVWCDWRIAFAEIVNPWKHSKIISKWKVSEKILSIPKHCQLAKRDLQASESISVISICVH